MEKPQENTQPSQPDPQALEEQLKRALADYANLKKRFEKEREEITQFSNEVLLLQLLGIVDGLEMTLKELHALLDRHGFSKIEVNVGDQFDPKIMEAIDKSQDGDAVTQVYAPAYKLHDKVVRPAKVQVGQVKHSEDKKS